MRRTQLSCYVCGGPIKKADHDHGEITLVDYRDPPGIVRAWHNKCASGFPRRCSKDAREVCGDASYCRVHGCQL